LVARSCNLAARKAAYLYDDSGKGQSMNKETKALIDSLRAVSSHADPIANALMLKTMTPKKQHDYADMLKELSDLLHEHATNQETGSGK
jgi:hypothetical protein